MTIPVWPDLTGQVFLRNFDQGMVDTIGAITDPTNPPGDPRFILTVPGATDQTVKVYFAKPEAIFRKKVYPFITIDREEFTPALHRWMGVGQLEYRTGVSGTQIFVQTSRDGTGVSGFGQYQTKPQAIPYDIVYTVTCFDRYEGPAQAMLLKLLKVFPPVGKVFVSDSLGLNRTYEAYQEGAIANLKEVIDPVTRFIGYAITVRVEGELDLADPSVGNTVTGFGLNLHRF